ncbi:DUF5345 family protein [Paenibacillus cymbidii]|uniref:DUF5345 family protein n=1 Tax=Paenibacillus cymbidii TaxID=1639034 RepID=UPI001081446A|nr:DUF5345 family protein [Paenibacillus cymbidii]
MGKRDRDKTVPAGNQPAHEPRDADVTEAVQAALEWLDREQAPTPPDPAITLALLEEHDRVLRRRFLRDLLLFALLAVCVLAAMFGLYAATPAALLALQAAAVTLAPLLVARLYRKRVKE